MKTAGLDVLRDVLKYDTRNVVVLGGETKAEVIEFIGLLNLKFGTVDMLETFEPYKPDTLIVYWDHYREYPYWMLKPGNRLIVLNAVLGSMNKIQYLCHTKNITSDGDYQLHNEIKTLEDTRVRFSNALVGFLERSELYGFFEPSNKNGFYIQTHEMVMTGGISSDSYLLNVGSI